MFLTQFFEFRYGFPGFLKIIMKSSHSPVFEPAVAVHFDAVIYGHTHAVDIRTVPHASGSGQTLILNSGEACGWLHDRATAALLDLETLDCEIVEFDPR